MKQIDTFQTLNREYLYDPLTDWKIIVIANIARLPRQVIKNRIIIKYYGKNNDVIESIRLDATPSELNNLAQSSKVTGQCV